MWRSGIALGALAAALAGGIEAHAQVQVPVQVTPAYAEPGVPAVTISPTNPLAGADGNGTGTGTDTGDGSGLTGTGTTGTGSTGTSSDALNTLLAQSWGATAVTNAEAVGVNPSALAATCVVESGCQNVSGSGAQGAFQMYSAAYQEGLQTALAANPSLASSIVQGSAGMNDPTTEAIAASGYLMQANSQLQAAGVTNPTVLQARALYNYGPTSGLELAQADPSETMSQAMPNVSASTLAANGVTAGETVAQWNAAESAKIGNAASASIMG
jgi:hypothetical protein